MPGIGVWQVKVTRAGAKCPLLAKFLVFSVHMHDHHAFSKRVVNVNQITEKKQGCMVACDRDLE